MVEGEHSGIGIGGIKMAAARQRRIIPIKGTPSRGVPKRSLTPSLSSLCDAPNTQPLPLLAILQFIRLSSHLKDDILLGQPATVSVDCAPAVIPPAVASFLSEATNIPLVHIDTCWDVLKDEAWLYPTAAEVNLEDEKAFVNYGWARGLMHTARTPTAPPRFHSRKQNLVKSSSTLLTRSNIRTYYGGSMLYIKVGDHQYVERKLAAMWISMMLLAWVSATNCARIYDMALSEKQISNISAGGWQFGTLLTTDHIWDAFIILTLLDLHERNGTRLQVPHTGDQKDRFTAAMEERNLYVNQHGQDEAGHFCKKCMQTWDEPDGSQRKCQVIVSDGLNMGFPCCGQFRCTNPLTNNRHRFCTQHFGLHDLHAHAEMECLHNERGKAAFTLKDRLQKHRTTHPNHNSTIPMPVEDEDPNVEDDTADSNSHTFTVEVDFEYFDISFPGSGYPRIRQVGISLKSGTSSSEPPLIWQERRLVETRHLLSGGSALAAPADGAGETWLCIFFVPTPSQPFALVLPSPLPAKILISMSTSATLIPNGCALCPAPLAQKKKRALKSGEARHLPLEPLPVMGARSAADGAHVPRFISSAAHPDRIGGGDSTESLEEITLIRNYRQIQNI
ncbi:hypothetical protein GGX14DRAFT_629178 [Mycena pura]|uniref:CxC6 like cysteine cluster associated with KDZ domain-containing protein n=1 Tax=Mycena pura TaxID=153505 RepID=A0AAD7E425_9AGAR|nr:hypothetical protein GGX14DRAFT_629178 [Mycena pura]